MLVLVPPLPPRLSNPLPHARPLTLLLPQLLWPDQSRTLSALQRKLQPYPELRPRKPPDDSKDDDNDYEYATDVDNDDGVADDKDDSDNDDAADDDDRNDADDDHNVDDDGDSNDGDSNDRDGDDDVDDDSANDEEADDDRGDEYDDADVGVDDE